MPTGYTAAIENGDITTGKEFIKRCARAFGIAMDMRDEPLDVPLPNEFKENNTYYIDRLNGANEELIRIKNLTSNEIQNIIDEEYNVRQTSCKEEIINKKLINSRYNKILSEVELWNPLTDEHTGVKKFAIEQIKMCMDEDYSYYEEQLKQPKPEVEEWLNNKIANINRDIEYYREKVKEERNHIASKNLWLKQFRDSLV